MVIEAAIEPHITDRQIMERGCEFGFSYRPNQNELFDTLDSFIQVDIANRASSNLTTVSQNRLFNFNFPDDFMNCKEIYWSDGDHLSAAGEVRFGHRLQSGFLAFDVAPK